LGHAAPDGQPLNPVELTPHTRAYVVRQDDRGRGIDVMSWDVLGGMAKFPMTNVRQLGLANWRRLTERPENRCLVPLTEFCEWTPGPIDLQDGKKPIRGEMWFQALDQPLFAVAGFWQQLRDGPGFTKVTCDPNELVAPIHPKAMITILAPEDHDRWLTGASLSTERMTVRGPEFPTRSK
jgi:putative SOS response-associated peptidase YedK